MGNRPQKLSAVKHITVVLCFVLPADIFLSHHPLVWLLKYRTLPGEIYSSSNKNKSEWLEKLAIAATNY